MKIMHLRVRVLVEDGEQVEDARRAAVDALRGDGPGIGERPGVVDWTAQLVQVETTGDLRALCRDGIGRRIEGM